MNSKLIIQLKETLIIPIIGFISLVLFSFSLGWNLLTALLFWFLLIPILANQLPRLISKKYIYPKQSIIGLIVFYAFMICMIYDHYQTDLFRLMIISLVGNIFLVLFVTWVRRQNRLST